MYNVTLIHIILFINVHAGSLETVSSRHRKILSDHEVQYHIAGTCIQSETYEQWYCQGQAQAHPMFPSIFTYSYKQSNILLQQSAVQIVYQVWLNHCFKIKVPSKRIITMIYYILQFKEILLENQAMLNEQVRQAKYEAARKVQKYYLKCLHQLVNGGKNSDESTNSQPCHTLSIVSTYIIILQMLLRAQNPNHLITSRKEFPLKHTGGLSVLVILNRICSS